jgi:hypothetical protein
MLLISTLKRFPNSIHSFRLPDLLHSSERGRIRTMSELVTDIPFSIIIPGFRSTTSHFLRPDDQPFSFDATDGIALGQSCQSGITFFGMLPTPVSAEIWPP